MMVYIQVGSLVGLTVPLSYSLPHYRYSLPFKTLGGAAHLVGGGCFILMIGVLVLASHARVTEILAATVGPTVGALSCVGSRWRNGTLVDFGGATHLVGDGSFILVTGVLVLASHAGVTAILAATVGPTVGAFVALFGIHTRSGGNSRLLDFGGAAHLVGDGSFI
jgi:hypothetical protein